jgi:hypothetical protein
MARAISFPLNHFTIIFETVMPFYPITCTEEGEYAALLEIGKIDEWMDKNPGIVQEGKLSFLQEINEESNPVCVIVEP